MLLPPAASATVPLHAPLPPSPTLPNPANSRPSIHAIPTPSFAPKHHTHTHPNSPTLNTHPPQHQHQQELSRYGHLKTSEQLQSMLAALQKEVDTNTGHARKAAVSAVGRVGVSHDNFVRAGGCLLCGFSCTGGTQKCHALLFSHSAPFTRWCCFLARHNMQHVTSDPHTYDALSLPPSRAVVRVDTTGGVCCC